MKCIAALICLFWSASAEELPAGTAIEIRLKTKIASNSSKPKDPVEAVVIKPVMSGDRYVIPYGATLRGQVKKAEAAAAADKRAVLELHFDQISGANGKNVKIATKVTE